MSWKHVAVISLAVMAAACGQPTATESPAVETPAPIPTTAPVPSGAYDLDPNHASLTWSVKHLGLSNYTAGFATFSAQAVVDQANPGISSLSLKLDPKSVRTTYSGNYKATHKDSPFATWEEAIHKGFLGSDKTPEITFNSTGFSLTGADTGTLNGTLTMNGVTKPVSFNVTMTGQGDHPFAGVPAFGVHAEGVIKRSDFEIAQGLNAALSDEVVISFDGEFLQPPPPAAP